VRKLTETYLGRVEENPGGIIDIDLELMGLFIDDEVQHEVIADQKLLRLPVLRCKRIAVVAELLRAFLVVYGITNN
jgi:hypothetical protein